MTKQLRTAIMTTTRLEIINRLEKTDPAKEAYKKTKKTILINCATRRKKVHRKPKFF